MKTELVVINAHGTSTVAFAEVEDLAWRADGHWPVMAAIWS